MYTMEKQHKFITYNKIYSGNRFPGNVMCTNSLMDIKYMFTHTAVR